MLEYSQNRPHQKKVKVLVDAPSLVTLHIPRLVNYGGPRGIGGGQLQAWAPLTQLWEGVGVTLCKHGIGHPLGYHPSDGKKERMNRMVF